jgi:hypothetical protein
MATNSHLTPTIITREALRILHQKANFIGSINRDYDDRFASSGGKIGSSLLGAVRFQSNGQVDLPAGMLGAPVAR